jgi:hypothetical protein
MPSRSRWIPVEFLFKTLELMVVVLALMEMAVFGLKEMVALNLKENGAGGLDGDLESEEDNDGEAGEDAAGIGANLVNEFGINEEQLHNELHHTPVDANNV